MHLTSLKAVWLFYNKHLKPFTFLFNYPVHSEWSKKTYFGKFMINGEAHFVCCVYVWVIDCAVLTKKLTSWNESFLFIMVDCWKSWECISLSPFPTVVFCFKGRFYKQCSMVTSVWQTCSYEDWSRGLNLDYYVLILFHDVLKIFWYWCFCYINLRLLVLCYNNCLCGIC